MQIIVRPTTTTPAQNRALLDDCVARLEAKHPHRFVNCPSCEGVGYLIAPWAKSDLKELDREPCPCCDGSGLVLPEERDNWLAFDGGAA